MNNKELVILHDIAIEVRRLREKIELLTDGGRMRQPFWSADQAMQFLGIRSKTTLYKMAEKLGGVRIGREWRFKPEWLQELRTRGEL